MKVGVTGAFNESEVLSISISDDYHDGDVEIKVLYTNMQNDYFVCKKEEALYLIECMYKFWEGRNK